MTARLDPAPVSNPGRSIRERPQMRESTAVHPAFAGLVAHFEPITGGWSLLTSLPKGTGPRGALAKSGSRVDDLVRPRPTFRVSLRAVPGARKSAIRTRANNPIPGCLPTNLITSVSFYLGMVPVGSILKKKSHLGLINFTSIYRDVPACNYLPSITVTASQSGPGGASSTSGPDPDTAGPRGLPDTLPGPQ